MIARTTGGEDWAPRLVKDTVTGAVIVDEQTAIREAWADLAEEYEWGKMPPWAAVTVVMASYTIPRLTMPSTLSRIDKVKLWWKMRKMDNEAKARAIKEQKEKDAKAEAERKARA